MATFSYYDLNHVKRNFSIDVFTGAASYTGSGPIDPTAATTDPGTVFHHNLIQNWDYLAIPVAPYFIVRKLGVGTPPTPFTTQNWEGGVRIHLTGAATGTPRYRAIEFYGTYDTGNKDVGLATDITILGLPTHKRYLVLAVDAVIFGRTEKGTAYSYAPLAANVKVNNCSRPAGTDGEIHVNVTSGSGDYTLTFEDASTTDLNSGAETQSYARTGLAAGNTYSVNVHDNLMGTDVLIENITITEPVIEHPTETLFNVPKCQSIEFCHEIVPNGFTSFQNLDNVRYVKQVFPYFELDPYYIKLCKTDPVITVQWQSNYDTHVVEIRKYCDDSLVGNLPSFIKKNNFQVSEDEPITLRDNGDGRTRVYFASAIFPIVVKVGDVMGINSNADGFNGNYSVQGIALDTIRNSQYFIINAEYTPVADHSDANGVFFEISVDFNVFESQIDFSAYDNDLYYVKIYPNVLLGGEAPVTAVSEPIDLDDEHVGTNVIKFKSSDNCWDIDYSTGIQHFLRVESVFFKRKPKSIIDTIRNTSGQLYKTRALKQRMVSLELIMLPPWLHEKISILWDCDYVELNGVQYVTDQQYNEPAYLFNYGLSNSDIDVEQFQWMKTYNTDDLGGQLMPGTSRIFDGTFDATFN